jgi:5,10-methylene-tetrahydrofolate dehydrogenase/methenyl tetrahydrofolate cyclohydrolase
VVDVEINYVDDPESKKGYTIKCNVKYDVAITCASAITPVPGGIGPLTIAMLLSNTIKSVQYAQQL